MARLTGLRAVLAVVTLGTLASLASCDALTQESRFWTCYPCNDDPHPDNPCPCAIEAGPVGCPGQCMPIGPLNWTRDPFLLWIGDSDIAAPDCPERARKLGYEGHADLVAPDECGPCSCGAPSCELPAGLTANSTTCVLSDDPGTIYTPFDAPPDWDGSCVAPPAVPANLLGSVTIAPLTVSPCIAETGPIPTKGQAYWKTYARACLGEAFGPCGDSAQVCSPTAEPPPDGFSQCIQYLREGDADCPGEYPVKHVFYEGLNDTRNCSQCTCSAPVGSDCSAYISLYTDAGCATDLMGNVLQTANAAICLDVAAGNQLQSKSATPVDNQPGYCQASGGVPYGEATPTAPSTFCCQE
jgi:hypothetical protein